MKILIMHSDGLTEKSKGRVFFLTLKKIVIMKSQVIEKEEN